MRFFYSNTVFLTLFCLLSFALKGDDSNSGVNLLLGNFETGSSSFNPWAGVDDTGSLRVTAGTQFAVDQQGQVTKSNFSPSIAVGDLNGDGLPDLVVADAHGFVWYYPNSGTATAPVFTHGEIIPIWFGIDPRSGDVVPRIQLIDCDGDGKLDIVAGTFDGTLWVIRNKGSTTAPDFRMPSDPTILQVPTRSDKHLWCNFIAPFLYDWSGTGRLDLLFGDGTYSANSIYLLSNQGSNDRPVFNEKMMDKIIPGMGREHLTPLVVDWNNDGKPDILAGEREGFINLYLNQATDKTAPPVFDKDNPQHISLGATSTIGDFVTVCAASLTKNKLFDLFVGKPGGYILDAPNIGTLGAPKFNAPVPLKGTNPYPKILLPQSWAIDSHCPYGAPNEVLECVNAQIEPNFTPPPDFNGKGAMKFSILVPKNQYFQQVYSPRIVNDPHDIKRTINYNYGVNLATGTRYELGFWVRGSGDVSDLTWRLYGSQHDRNDEVAFHFFESDPISVNESWNKTSQRFSFDSKSDKPNEVIYFTLSVNWAGDGSVYFDGFTLKKVN